MDTITFEPVLESERDSFAADCAESLSVALRENFPSQRGVPVSDIFESLAAAGAEAFHIICGGSRVGGAVVVVNALSRRNSLDLLFLKRGACGKGIGLAVWRAIEKKYPDAEVWETITPYFERRNIHFYVNKCGFKIVEFFNPRHRDPHCPDMDSPGRDYYFRFEKQMRPSGA